MTLEIYNLSKNMLCLEIIRLSILLFSKLALIVNSWNESAENIKFVLQKPFFTSTTLVLQQHIRFIVIYCMPCELQEQETMRFFFQNLAEIFLK